MKAILSDIHGNLEALQAVLADIRHYPVGDIYCLGDLVGYGPNPCECVDLALEWKVTLLGGFDVAVAQDEPNVGESMLAANRSLAWSKAQLSADPSAAGQRRWAFLRERPAQHTETGFLFVHGSPVRPVNDFVYPAEVSNPGKLGQLFAPVPRHCFHGQTHEPAVVTANGEVFVPDCTADVFRLDRRKALVNVGSVGQPHDGDWRACYVLVDGDVVRFRRVKYDIEATVGKIYRTPELENYLGDRLRDGR